jgi:ketosteroid isomerase-like protein
LARANLDVVRGIYEPWGRGDFRAVEWADPEIEFVLADVGPESGCWKGVSAMAAAWRRYLGAWDCYRTEVDEYRELDDERVLVLLRLSGRGRTSGVQLAKIRTEAANLFHLQGGRVTRLVLYADRERGLADLGLSEPKRSPAPERAGLR